MSSLSDIPELRELDSRKSLVRIPHEEDVPLTPRVRQLIDTAEFRRLARISQNRKMVGIQQNHFLGFREAVRRFLAFCRSFSRSFMASANIS